jgi:molybdate transport system permease protein
VSTLVYAPLVLPPVVTGFLLLKLLGRRGALGSWLAENGVTIPFTFAGAVVASVVVGFPLFVAVVRSAFEAVDRRHDEVAATLGLSPLRVFLRVTLPLAAPGILAGAVLSFARALGEFGATIVLAGNIEGETRTIPMAVYSFLESTEGEEPAWRLVWVSLGLCLAAMLGFELLVRRHRRLLELDRGR